MNATPCSASGSRCSIPAQWLVTAFAFVIVLSMSACSTLPPPETVDRVDLDRYMGDWYVHSGLLTGLEKDIYNAVETYELDEKGRVQTTYRLRKGGFDGPVKTYHPTGFIHDETTYAEWRMQFIWPFRLPYYVVYLDEEYQMTAVGTRNRKYIWFMSRSPDPESSLLEDAYETAREKGYDLTDMVTVPHRWPESTPEK